MSDPKFVNRIDELNFLSNQVEFIGKQTKVILLNGKTGVGKSGLTKRFFEQSQVKFGIKVPIDDSMNQTFDEGYFIKKIALAIDSYFRENENRHSFKSFENTISAIVNDKRLIKAIVNDIGDSIPGFKSVKTIIQKIKGDSEFSREAIFNSESSEIILLLKDYLISNFENNDFILNIENIQSIDQTSFETLKTLIKKTKGSIFLLEFTPNKGVELSILMDHLGKFTPKIYTIEPLSEDNIDELISHYPEVRKEILSQQLINWNGNLIHLRNMIYTITHKIETPENYNINNAASFHFGKLAAEEKFILFIVRAHVDLVDMDQLEHLLNYNPELFTFLRIDLIIGTLEEKEFIKVEKGSISFYHDSIHDRLTEVKESALYMALADKFWFTYYEQLLKRKDIYFSKSQQLIKLLYFSTKLSYVSLVYSLLDRIKEEAKTHISQKKLISYVANMKDQLTSSGDFNELKKIRLWLIEMYLNLSLADKALSLLDEVEEPSLNVRVLYLILLEMTGQQKKAIELIDKELIDSELAPKYELTLRLIRLQCKYDIGKYKFCKKEYEKIRKRKVFKTEFEYGFFLRNAELVYSNKESLDYYPKSIEHFLRYNAYRQAAFSRITYSIYLGLLGYFKKGETQLDLASKVLFGDLSERHTILNNKGVFSMYSKNYEQAADYFRQGLISAELDFNKFALSSNLLAVYDILEMDDKIPPIIAILEEILIAPRFATQRIKWYAYYNLYRFYKRTKENENAQIYLDHLDSKPIKKSDFWKFWVQGKKLKKTDENYFRFQLPRPISYLTHWGLDYDSELMNFE